MRSLSLPTTNGWMVTWYTGEVKTIKYKNGRTKDVRMMNSFESTSKAKVDAKADEMKSKGYEIESICECIF